MADNMWNLLKFLKNPQNEIEDTPAETQKEKGRIDAQLIEALGATERAVDEALAEESAAVAEDISPEEAEKMLLLAEAFPDEKEEMAAEALLTEGEAADEPSVAEYDVIDEPLDEKLITFEQAEESIVAIESMPEPEIIENKPTMQVEKTVSAHGRELVSSEARSLESLVEKMQKNNDGSESEEEQRLLDVPIERVTANPFQPRFAMAEDDIAELSDSIKEVGVLQPILVKKISNDSYELIAGERRLRASKRAGLASIPALVVEVDQFSQQLLALVENLQRKNLSAVEEGRCLHDILSRTSWSQTELARRLGRSQAAVANKIRLLKLDGSVQQLVIDGKLGERQARALIGLTEEDQQELAQRAIDNELSARELEMIAESQHRGEPRGVRRGPRRARPEYDGPAGGLLHDLATLINRHRNLGIPAKWTVRGVDQSSLVVEIVVDFNKNEGAE